MRLQEFYAEGRQRTAIHESGHVVVARYLQLPGKLVEVGASALQQSSVQCLCGGSLTPVIEGTGYQRSTWMARLLVCIAPDSWPRPDTIQHVATAV
jgi:hypothetical protein